MKKLESAKITPATEEAAKQVEITLRDKKEVGLSHWGFMVLMILYLAVFLPFMKDHVLTGTEWADVIDRLTRYALVSMGIWWPATVAFIDEKDVAQFNGGIVVSVLGTLTVYGFVSFIGMVLGWFGSFMISS